MLLICVYCVVCCHLFFFFYDSATNEIQPVRTPPSLPHRSPIQVPQGPGRLVPLGNRAALVLAALLGLGALLVVGNTVRLDIQARREEIGVLQHLGASDGFIRRPFLYLGAWYGLGAGLVAIALLSAAALALRTPLAELAASFGSHFALSGFDPVAALAAVAGAALLGWLGAGIVTGHYLRQTRPTET